MVPAVFDEPAAGGAATAHGAGYEQAGARGFVRGGVEKWGAGFVGGVGLDAEAAEQGLVGMVAGEGVHEIGRHNERAVGREDFHGIGPDGADGGVEVRRDAAFVNAVDEVGANPVLHGVAHGGAAHNKRDLGTGAGKLESRFSRRVFGSHYHNVLGSVLVGLLVIMANVRQGFAGHVERIGHIVEAGGYHHVTGTNFALVGRNREIALLTGQGLHFLVQAHNQLFGAGHALVIIQGVFAQGLVVAGGEGIIANFEQLGRGEELHVSGVADQGIDQRALFYQGHAQAPALGFEGAGKANRAGTNNENVEHIIGYLTLGWTVIK